MLKFLRWFMKLFRPETSGFVKNMQTTDHKSTASASMVSKGKKAVYQSDQFYWIPTNKIVEIKKNSQGITTEIRLASGTEFVKVNNKGAFKQSAKKQGLSRVMHHVEFSLFEQDRLLGQAEELKSNKMNISILHINKFGDGFLYGETKGLSVLANENGNLVLEGSEDNVFYEMTKECLQRVVPKTE